MENAKKPNKVIEFEKSSLLEKAEYDPFMNVLSITFHNGRNYEFIEVEEKVFTELSSAKSPGRYFHQHIRNSYEFLKSPIQSDKNEEE